MTRYNIHQVEIIQAGLDHPECVNFGPDGRLYAGGFAGQVYVMTPPKFELQQLAQTEGFVGGVAVDGNHNVYVCNATRHSVLRVTQKGQISVYCDRAPDGPLILPNYGSFDFKGNYYFSDSGDYWKPNGRLMRVKPTGQCESLIGGNWHYPNGLAISPRDGSVLMIESTAADIVRIPVNNDGMVGRPEIYAQLQGNVPDGLAFSRSGNLYVSCYCPNRIYAVSPDRNVELLIEDPTGEILSQPTNVAFEPNGSRLFFANLGGQHIGALDVGEPGAFLCYPRL
jgi:gluconolactonase